MTGTRANQVRYSEVCDEDLRLLLGFVLRRMADDDGSRKVILRSAGAHAFHMTRDDGVQAGIDEPQFGG